jgi:SAM-dependent methyltransferase
MPPHTPILGNRHYRPVGANVRIAVSTTPGGAVSQAEVEHNRTLWTHINAAHTDADAHRAWSLEGIRWGLFAIPEAELGVLGDVKDKDAVELGCGTAFFSAALARAGARPVGVDVTPAQLATARRCQRELGPQFPLVEADATRTPLPDSSFDLAVSEYGASLWCEPDAWVAEAARLLRPGGRLAFLTNSVLAALCVPTEAGVADTTLQRPLRDLGRVEWPGGGIEYHVSHGRWIEVLTRHGFVVEALHELYAPDSATEPDYYEIVSADWAGQWPAEELWVCRLS